MKKLRDEKHLGNDTAVGGRTFSVALLLALTLSLSACGGSASGSGSASTEAADGKGDNPPLVNRICYNRDKKAV